MKKMVCLRSLFITGIALVTLVSCQKQDDYEVLSKVETVSDLSTRASVNYDKYSVSQQNAILLAKALKPKETIVSIEPIEARGDTLIWFINYENGWLALAGDKRIQPILARDSGNNYKDNNYEYSTWINMCAEGVLATKRYGKDCENEHTKLWDFILSSKYLNTKEQIVTRGDGTFKWAVFLDDTISYSLVTGGTMNHLMSTKWGQGSPWNVKLPIDTNSGNYNLHCVTGCVPVAIGQLLKYYNSFFNLGLGLYHSVYCSYSTVQGSTTDVGFDHGAFTTNSPRWNLMANDSAASAVYTGYAGDLMLELGNRLGTSYSYSNSFTQNSSTLYVSVFNSYDLTCSTSSYSFANVKNSLDNDLPIMITAFPSYGGGHCWIIDGYRERTDYYTSYYHLEYTDEYEDAIATYSEADLQSLFGDYYCDGYSWEETMTYAGGNYLLMNWGHDGDRDSGEFYVIPTEQQWIYSVNPYIYYNFTQVNN